MTAKDYFNVLRDYWKSIGIIFLTACILGLALFILTPRKYTATTALYVAAQNSDGSTAAYQGTLLSQQRVVSYVEIAKSKRILDAVIASSGLSEDSSALAKQIEVQNAKDSTIINILVTDASPAQSASLANRVATEMVNVVNELEKPAVPNQPPAVVLRTVETASAPSEPSSPGWASFVGIAGLLGVFVGIGSALVRNSLDTTIKTTDSLKQIVNAPVLGLLGEDSHASPNRLIVTEEPLSSNAEAFRRLRTNLQFIDPHLPCKSFVITSAEQGEGKTTTVANLALVLADAGNRVAVVDADLRRPRQGDLFGVESSVGLTSVLIGKTTLGSALQPSSHPRLSILPSGPLPPNPSELLGTQQAARLFNDLRNGHDYVLIDTPPVLPVTDATIVATLVDGAIFVARFGVTGAQEVIDAREALLSAYARIVGTVLSVAPRGGPSDYYYAGYGPTGHKRRYDEAGTTDRMASEALVSSSSQPSPSPRSTSK